MRPLIQKLERARDFLLSRHPFYGCLAMQLPDVIDSADNPTACTDGNAIYWNPEFLDALTDEETRYVLAEETLHCAHGHLWRLKPDYNANLAADYEIREILHGLPGLTLPAMAAAQPGVYPDLSAEEIYAILSRRPPPPAGAAPRSIPGSFRAPAAPGTAEGEAIREKWEAATQSAGHMAAAGAGTLPADLARAIAARARVVVDWRAEMATWLRSTSTTRADYVRSARRMATAPVIYPRRIPAALHPVVVIRDTSGSIAGPVMDAFTSAARSIIAEMGCPILLIDCDSRVQAVHRIAPGDAFPPEAAGGGGTDFRPPFAEIARLQSTGEEFAGAVYLTDLDGPEPDSVPCETLWLSTIPTSTAATGRTIPIYPETIA